MRYIEQDELPFEEPAVKTARFSRGVERPVIRPTFIPFREENRTRTAERSNRYPESASPIPPAVEPEEKTPWHERAIEQFFATPPPVDPLKKNGRLYLALCFFILAYFLVIGKLFKLQVVDHAAFSEAAAGQYQKLITLQARRGLIRDRNGVILAANAYVEQFAVEPKYIQDKEKLAERFSEVFGKPAKLYLAIFNDTSRKYVVIEKEVPIDIASQLDSVKDHGLVREMESRRNYAFNERASHVLGFTSKDGRGLAGIELFDNKDLAGKDGSQILQVDGHGIRRPDVDYPKTPAVDGDNLTLTIDESIQSFAETALKAGVETAKAEAGIAIVMRPSTGEILAIANVPDFNPNNFGLATNEMLRDRAITDAYEPGSTIKVLTASAVLEDGLMRPDDKVDAEHGHWNPEPGVRITDTHPYGILTFRQALEKSSNISFAKISDRLDKRRFYKYLRDFGIGNYTGIDLPGEVKGVLHKPASWQSNSKRYMAFGYELTATPIQMATAYATVANMGIMMKPYLIAKREGLDGTIETEPQEIRRVVSEATCRTLIGMMEGVVDSGTATLTKIKGVRIAGKTGTAQQLVDGHWSKEHYTSSFTGFFPAEKPEYLISVILRSPHNGYYGGTVSGPIFREIAMHIMDMNGTLPAEARAQPKEVKPRVDEGVVDIDGTLLSTREGGTREMPDVRGLTVESGRSLLASQGFTVIGAKDGSGIIGKVEKCSRDTVRFVIVDDRSSTKAMQNGARASGVLATNVVPDMVGMPIARAIAYASANGLRVVANGTGIVKRQIPPANTAIEPSQSNVSPTVMLFGEEQ
jgi:cell division protein FtsI (penicillin-binding protein 3)